MIFGMIFLLFCSPKKMIYSHHEKGGQVLTLDVLYVLRLVSSFSQIIECKGSSKSLFQTGKYQKKWE